MGLSGGIDTGHGREKLEVKDDFDYFDPHNYYDDDRDEEEQKINVYRQKKLGILFGILM